MMTAHSGIAGRALSAALAFLFAFGLPVFLVEAF